MLRPCQKECREALGLDTILHQRFGALAPQNNFAAVYGDDSQEVLFHDPRMRQKTLSFSYKETLLTFLHNNYLLTQ